MKIIGSNIKMTSKHSMTQTHTRWEYLKVWDQRGERASPKPTPDSSTISYPNSVSGDRDRLELSPYAQAFIEGLERNPQKKSGHTQPGDILKNRIKQEPVRRLDKVEKRIKMFDEDLQKILVLEKLISALTGKEIKLKIPDWICADQEIEVSPAPALTEETIKSTGLAPPVQEGWGVDYRYEEVYRETEKLAFNAEGIIKTADGKEINFSVDLFMSREFMIKNNLSIQAGDAKIVDPIVINYSGAAAGITKTKFTFDLDADGNTEEIPFITPGSGFLVLDKNQDGIINNGRELFGPSTGDGFLELRKYDSDNNGWLDENDSIYENLRIWTKDADGRDRLFALGQVGIGAIYLGNVEATFTYKNNANETEAMNRSAGIFVRENGSVGTVQQVDLVI